MDQMEFQYSPSMWVNRFTDPEKVIENHMAVTSKASNDAKANLEHEEAIRYGTGEKQLFDVFGTSLPNDAPIVVYIHGGYWQLLDRTLASYPAGPLVRKGIRVVVGGYDLAPKVSLERIVSEIQELACVVLELALNQGSKSVWFMGHSAGAHLASSLLSNAWLNSLNLEKRQLLKGMVLISGVFDLTPLLNTTINDALKLNRQEAEVLSTSQISENVFIRTLKFLIAVAEHDSDEFRRQSAELQIELGKVAEAELLLIDGVDHFDIVEKLADDEFILTKKVTMLVCGSEVPLPVPL